MKPISWREVLWGREAKLSTLLLAAAVLLLTLLGTRDIWTQEHRWADIVAGMFYRQDFFHPFLGENQYYDKPLLSYWFIAGIAKLTGVLTTWALRLPSALAGLLAIVSIYHLGCRLKDKQLGLLSGWMLLTTFYFVFWARTSSADMLNLAGSLAAVAWYFAKRDQANFFDYSVFFLIVALTSLCKGLIGAVVPAIAVGIDILLQKSWRQYCRWSFFVSMLPALYVYLLPFWLSSHVDGANYSENGLYLVYRENILRYFKPFDHKGPIYTYFLYLPLYLLPWTLFFVPALYSVKKRWQTMSLSTRWIGWTLCALFLFLTLSGSRRSYYVLPLLPFAVLLTAEWILTVPALTKRITWSARLVPVAFLLLLLMQVILPAWYYSHFGVSQFARKLQAEASQQQVWNSWNVVLLDAESKLNFYLQLPPQQKNYHINSSLRTEQTSQSLAERWPVLNQKPANTIFITRKRYRAALQPYFKGYHIVALPVVKQLYWQQQESNSPIAFVPD